MSMLPDSERMLGHVLAQCRTAVTEAELRLHRARKEVDKAEQQLNANRTELKSWIEKYEQLLNDKSVKT